MEIIECIKTRRSVRKFEEKPIPRELLAKIAEAAAYAPSWKNSQTVRYTFIDSRELLNTAADTAVLGFEHNAGIIRRAACIAVQSVVTGICGYEPDGSFSTSKNDSWEMYDAGISAQTFCLAAHDMGIGCVIMGIIDDNKFAELAKLPEGQRITAVIAMGIPAAEPKMPPKKTAEEIMRFV